MDLVNSRRFFIKQLLTLSACSAGLVKPVKRIMGGGIVNLGATKAFAMDNPDYAAPLSANTVRIKYIGMSCFLVTTSDGTRIILDPISQLGKEPADIITVSCGHYYHCDVYWVGGFPSIYRRTEPATMNGIPFRGVETRHLVMAEGQKIRAGVNYVIGFEAEGINICHLGALGHTLSNEQVNKVGKVDILMVPVGGVSTLPIADAAKVCGQLNPRVIIPMNYRDDRYLKDPSWASVDEFLKNMDRGENILRGARGGLGMMEFKSSELPSETQVIVL